MKFRWNSDKKKTKIQKGCWQSKRSKYKKKRDGVQQSEKFQKATKVLTNFHDISQHKVIYPLKDTIYLQVLNA